MSKPTDQQIEDCRVRGIVPGAVIQDASGLGRGTVSPYREWSLVEGALGRYISCGRDDTGFVLFAKHANNRFATVLTPAPNPTTLTPGMACIIESAAGRQFIKELAEAKGVWDSLVPMDCTSTKGFFITPRGTVNQTSLRASESILHYIPAHEFIRLLMEYEPPTPPKTTEELLKAIMGPLTMLARCLSQAHYSDSGEYLDAEDVQEAYDELKGIAMRMGLVTF